MLESIQIRNLVFYLTRTLAVIGDHLVRKFQL